MHGQNDRGFSPSPVKEGDVVSVKIEAKGKSGDGLAKVEGFVVFVPGVEVGDEVNIRISSVRRKFAIGEVTDAAVSKPAEEPKEEAAEEKAEEAAEEEPEEAAEKAPAEKEEAEEAAEVKVEEKKDE